jgi:hypothetical protein
MTEFETIEKHETEFGNNDFVQVARKIARDDDSTTEFIALTRGYLDAQGSRRYKTNLTLPPDGELLDFVEESLAKV